MFFFSFCSVASVGSSGLQGHLSAASQLSASNVSHALHAGERRVLFGEGASAHLSPRRPLHVTWPRPAQSVVCQLCMFLPFPLPCPQMRRCRRSGVP